MPRHGRDPTIERLCVVDGHPGWPGTRSGGSLHHGALLPNEGFNSPATFGPQPSRFSLTSLALGFQEQVGGRLTMDGSGTDPAGGGGTFRHGNAPWSRFLASPGFGGSGRYPGRTRRVDG